MTFEVINDENGKPTVYVNVDEVNTGRSDAKSIDMMADVINSGDVALNIMCEEVAPELVDQNKGVQIFGLARVLGIAPAAFNEAVKIAGVKKAEEQRELRLRILKLAAVAAVVLILSGLIFGW